MIILYCIGLLCISRHYTIQQFRARVQLTLVQLKPTVHRLFGSCTNSNRYIIFQSRYKNYIEPLKIANKEINVNISELFLYVLNCTFIGPPKNGWNAKPL